jgi:hypothetical protein
MPVQVIRPSKSEGAGKTAPFIHLSEREGSMDEWIKKAKAESIEKKKAVATEDTMKVKMLITKRASEDGITNREYFAGQEYDLRVELAESLIAKGLAELPGAEVKQELPIENKMEKKPENKKNGRRHLK